MTFTRLVTTKDGRFQNEVVECRTYGNSGKPPVVLCRTAGLISIDLDSTSFAPSDARALATEIFALVARAS